MTAFKKYEGEGTAVNNKHLRRGISRGVGLGGKRRNEDKALETLLGRCNGNAVRGEAHTPGPCVVKKHPMAGEGVSSPPQTTLPSILVSELEPLESTCSSAWGPSLSLSLRIWDSGHLGAWAVLRELECFPMAS